MLGLKGMFLRSWNFDESRDFGQLSARDLATIPSTPSTNSGSSPFIVHLWYLVARIG